MRTVAIIQARMTSSRFPGKVLLPLAGRPVLWHIIHRLRKCKFVDLIAVATSDHSTDDSLSAFAFNEGVEVVRGPKENVLARYMLAARQLGADIVVRVTGDAPLVDPVMVDRLVDMLIKKQVDYCVCDPRVPCIHEGFDPFTFRALQKLVAEAGNDPVAREHVTAYFKIHPDFVPVAYAPIDQDYQFSGARISVDTPADLRFLEEIYARMNVPAGEADVRDVVKLLRREPELLNINAHVYRKGATERSKRALFRCDGDVQTGLGHVVRCLALADELREGHGCGVCFAMSCGPIGFDLVRQAGYPIEQKDGAQEEGAWLDGVIKKWQPDVLMLDVRSEELPRSWIEKWRSEGMLIVTIDDSSDRRLAADLAFYPPVPQVQKMDWTGFTGRLYTGWEWVVLRKEFTHRPPRVPRGRPLVLVTMGGSDPAGLTLKAIEALDLLDEEFDALVVLGPGFSYDTALLSLLAKVRRQFEILRNVQGISNLMTQADLAVTSFGVTAYELAAVGVPAIYLCLTEDHAESANALVAAGIGVSLGLYTCIQAFRLAEVVRDILRDYSRRLKMMACAREKLDGKGAIRVARLIMGRLKDARDCDKELATT